MKEFNGIWLPDSDRHFKAYAKNGNYHNVNYFNAVKHVINFQTAIDCGAHVGFWTRLAAKDFKHVYAFEPILDNYECLRANIPDDSVVYTQMVALGNGGKCDLVNPKPQNSGAWERTRGDAYSLMKLDDMVFPEVGLIKIDVQSMELDVLKGAERLLLKDRPVIQVETVYAKVRDLKVPAYLTSLGFELQEKTGKDEIWTFT